MLQVAQITAFQNNILSRYTNKTLPSSITKVDHANSFNDVAGFLMELLPNGILNGLELSISGSNVLIQPGMWMIDSFVYAIATQHSLPIDTQDATYSRYDVVFADADNNINLISGALSLTPIEPAIPNNTVKLGSILITPAEITINPPPITNYVDTTSNQDVHGTKNFMDGVQSVTRPLDDSTLYAATTEWVQNQLNADVLWFRTGTFLGSGTEADPYSISPVAFLPDQTGNAGKVLKTDGTNVSWQTESGGGGSGTLTTISGVNTNGFTWSIANPTTTPALTLSLQNASTSQSGQLTSTDWNTFNNKQAALGFTPENVANKATDFSVVNNILYPSVQAVFNFVELVNTILTGLVTTTSGTTATTTAGTYRVNNTVYSIGTSTNTTIPAQDATLSRYSILYGTTSSTIAIVNGTLSLDPVEPNIPANTVQIATILITPTTVTVSGGGKKGTGSVTSVTSSTTDILVANSTTAPVLTLNKVNGTTISYYDPTSSIQTQLNSKAPLASPGLTGVPTAPTAANGTNTTQIATTAFVIANSGLGSVTSVTGTTNRITSTGGTTPVIDISSSYVGQSSITTLGTITTGTWQGTAIADTYISSASNWNTAYTNRITSLTTTGSSGAATLSSNVLNIPNYTLAGLGGVATSVTVAGFALTGNVTLANLSATDSTLTFSGTYNGSTARTIGINLGNANIWTAQQTINFNTGVTPPTVVFTGQTALQLIGLDANTNVLELVSGAGHTLIESWRYNGTGASKTGLVANDEILAVGGGGWYSSSARTAEAAAALQFFAGETWSVSANGSYATLKVTKNATTTLSTAQQWNNDFSSGIIGSFAVGNPTVQNAAAYSSRQICELYGSSTNSANPPTYITLANAAITSGTAGEFDFQAAYNSSGYTIARMYSQLTGSTANNKGGNWTFQTKVDGGSLTTVMSFDSSQNVNIPKLTASKVVFTDASKNVTSTGIGTSSQFIKGDGSLDSTAYVSGNLYTLDGTLTGNRTISTTSGFTLTIAPQVIFNGSITAASSLARGNYTNQTLTAAANNDVLIADDINPVFTAGAFTGVATIGQRVQMGTFGVGILATPGAPACTPSITGGTLAAGTYYYKIVATDVLGRTTLAGAETSAVVASGSTGKVVLTWTAVTYATGYRVYRGTSSNGQSVYYVPNNSVNGAPTFTDTGAANTAGTTPIVNGTVVSAIGTDGTINGVNFGYGNNQLNNNLVIGYQAGNAITIGVQNLFIGALAGTANTTGNSNTFIGYQAGTTNISNSQCVFIGYSAGQHSVADNNSAIGYQAGQAITSGTGNTIFGSTAGQSVQTGNYNTLVGNAAGVSLPAGSTGNTLVGNSAGSGWNNAVNFNTGFGDNVMNQATNGANNTSIGYNSGRNISAGNAACTTLDNSIFVGYQANPLANSQTNQIVIGYNVYGQGSNSTSIGNSSTTLALIYGVLNSPVGATASKNATVGGKIKEYFTDAGNTTTTETDLYTYTTEASMLSANGASIQAEYGGIFVSSATATRELKVYFGGTVIYDSGALSVTTSSQWTAYVSLIRVSGTIIRYMVSITVDGVTLTSPCSAGELTGLTLSNTNILKITGQAASTGAATNDIVGKLGAVYYWPVSV